MFDVAIIIPVFNNERSISRCLDSIVNQKTNHTYQVILVSDPSTDKTPQIVEEYVKKYGFISNIDVSTRSIALARNRGIEESDSKYLMFIDADDYFTDDAIETMISSLEKNNADVAAASYYYVRGKKISKNFFSKNKVYDKQGMLKALLQDSYMHGFMWNKIYKSELLKGRHYVVPKGNIIREDVLTNFQVFLNSNKLAMTSKPIYFYDKTYESSTSKVDKTRVMWFITIFAVERYLLEKHNPSFMKMYHSLQNRRKLLVWGDRQIVKHGYEKEEYKTLKKDAKEALKNVNLKGKLQINNMPWEEFIKYYF